MANLQPPWDPEKARKEKIYISPFLQPSLRRTDHLALHNSFTWIMALTVFMFCFPACIFCDGCCFEQGCWVIFLLIREFVCPKGVVFAVTFLWAISSTLFVRVEPCHKVARKLKHFEQKPLFRNFINTTRYTQQVLIFLSMVHLVAPSQGYEGEKTSKTETKQSIEGKKAKQTVC